MTKLRRGVDYAVLQGGARLRFVPQGTGERRGSCPRYMRCLDAAESFEWPGFDCALCPVSEQVPYERQRDDMRGMAEMWRSWFEVMRLTAAEIEALS